MTAPAGDASLEARVRMEIERAIQRSIKGLEYISTGDPAVGLTPKDVIHSRGTLKLYHYRPQADEVYRVPVMLVMSLVSKPYIPDLAPGQSLVEFLVKRGFDVYMIDWGCRGRRMRGCGSKTTCSTSSRTVWSGCSRTRASARFRSSATAWAGSFRRCTPRSIPTGR
ncbi:hypothetical protein O0235_01950 [Tepidiforma flava]|uniref:Poly-beta-hydroxybutyrate polymerase N-terminal domain-containing protein n=1 Tax=Tepidiforma flava TaxID=3004094 RepID=A0ABY7M778_9CHLR|nr:hypothetical protein [Tepidiforma flava]WBL36361.1 hypothetical protein O0235_01950 [Tepidiforma flava]